MTRAALTRHQQRAKHALEKARSVPQSLRPDYKSFAKSLPANIATSGLGQACAMLLAQADGKPADRDAHRLLYEHLQDWLCGGEHAAVYPDDPKLMEAVINNGQRKYVRAQAEALAYLEWLKKFAQAYPAGEED